MAVIPLSKDHTSFILRRQYHHPGPQSSMFNVTSSCHTSPSRTPSPTPLQRPSDLSDVRDVVAFDSFEDDSYRETYSDGTYLLFNWDGSPWDPNFEIENWINRPKGTKLAQYEEVVEEERREFTQAISNESRPTSVDGVGTPLQSASDQSTLTEWLSPYAHPPSSQTSSILSQQEADPTKDSADEMQSSPTFSHSDQSASSSQESGRNTKQSMTKEQIRGRRRHIRDLAYAMRLENPKNPDRLTRLYPQAHEVVERTRIEEADVDDIEKARRYLAFELRVEKRVKAARKAKGRI